MASCGVVDYVAAKKLLPAALAAALHDDGADVFTPELLARTVKSFDEIDTIAQAHVTKRVLYPGLDGLCQWLERYYERR